MNQKNTEKLYNDFPYLYRGRMRPIKESLMSWSFQCGDGWFKIIYALSAQITEHLKNSPELEIEVLQVKEKCGGLRFYIMSSENVPYSCGDETIYGLIRDAQNLSFITCEVCGRPGRSREDKNWCRTLCDACEQERIAKLSI